MKEQSIITKIILICLIPLIAYYSNIAFGQNWQAGTWDASFQLSSHPIHPNTVGVRFEVVDSQTLIEIEDVQVTLKGVYQEEHIRINQENLYELRQWELSTRTNESGIAVFALSWQKKYPWNLQRPQIPAVIGGGWSYAGSWIRPVDDIEKVQIAEIRHPRYQGINHPFNLSHLLQVGQDNSYGESQKSEVWERFEQAWQQEKYKPNVHYCVFSLGDNFSDIGNSASTRPEFFEAIQRKECKGFTGMLEHRGDVGPYLVYYIRVELDPVRRRY